jgi:hypothetical protein
VWAFSLRVPAFDSVIFVSSAFFWLSGATFYFFFFLESAEITGVWGDAGVCITWPMSSPTCWHSAFTCCFPLGKLLWPFIYYVVFVYKPQFVISDISLYGWHKGFWGFGELVQVTWSSTAIYDFTSWMVFSGG